MPRAPTSTSERRLVLLVGMVQFINILDFMMVMPLGPDFAKALGFPASEIGAVGGAYTAAACVAGLLGAGFLDRFDRKSALAVAMAGLVVGTAAGGFAVGLPSLMAARVIAGAFGGPAPSIALAIVADAVPPERRGKALGAVAGAFAAASVLGVPAGLEFARVGGWRAPFFAVACLGLVVAGVAVAALPSLRGHIGSLREGPSLASMARRPVVLLSWTLTATSMLGTFAFVPNLSTYVQRNLAYPREGLGRLYLAGGALSFFATRGVGWLVDRHGSARVGTIGSLFFIAAIYGLIGAPSALPVVVMFLAFMLANSFRNVPMNTLTSKVPAPAERARFMSIQSAVQHLAGSAGAFLSATLLWESADGAIQGMARVGVLAGVLALTFPVIAWAVESRLPGRLARTTPR